MVICDWQNCDPFAYQLPRAFERHDRFSHVAIEKGRMVGYWNYLPKKRGGRFRIKSWRTWVMGPYRRKRLALELWRSAIKQWEPLSIDALSVSPAGAIFLAYVKVHCIVEFPALKLEVDTDEHDALFRDSFCVFAEEKLRLLRSAGAKQPRPLLRAV